jgi:hypothetical protein
VSFSPITTAIWGTSLWGVATWGGDLTVFKNWQTMGKIGTCGAMNMIAASQIETRWMVSDFLYEPGGFVG